MNLLLALHACVNLQDKSGATPLHLSIRAAKEVGSTRPVRGLLLSGADVTIRSHNG